MSYTLCVIDMQAYFTAANGKKVQQSCAREIRQAKKNGATIVFVEYEGYGPTLPVLTDLVKSYKKVHHVLKQANGGGKNVADYLKQKHLTRSNMRVVGVNTSYCVLATLQEMNQHLKYSIFNVVADACACHGDTSHRMALQNMRKMNNVNVVRDKV